MKINLAYKSTSDNQYSLLIDKEALELLIRGLEGVMSEKLADRNFGELSRLSIEWEKLAELLKEGEDETDEN